MMYGILFIDYHKNVVMTSECSVTAINDNGNGKGKITKKCCLVNDN